jgi:dethiobiotin synthetase
MSLFVTGTDTGCGKTRVSAALLRACAEAGLRAVGMKPVATGAVPVNGRLVNEDVEALMAAANVAVPPGIVCPYLFEPPCSPHIAAASAGVRIDPDLIVAAFRQCQALADVVIVEGVGGWCVPVAEDLWIEDIARALGLPLLLVVGVRLGCINHAVLSARAIAGARQPLAGWIANLLEPGLHAPEAVLATLERSIPAPRAGTLEWAPEGDIEASARALAPVARRLAQERTDGRASPRADERGHAAR